MIVSNILIIFLMPMISVHMLVEAGLVLEVLVAVQALNLVLAEGDVVLCHGAGHELFMALSAFPELVC